MVEEEEEEKECRLVLLTSSSSLFLPQPVRVLEPACPWEGVEAEVEAPLPPVTATDFFLFFKVGGFAA